MPRMSPLLRCLAVLIASALPLSAQGRESAPTERAAPAQSPAAQPSSVLSLIEAEPLPSVELWRSWLERDATLSFNSRTVGAARRDLEAASSPPDRLAAAKLALAHSRAGDQREGFERGSKARTSMARLTAIFCLGALGEGVDARLLELAEDADPTVRSAAFVAMLASQRSALRRGLEELARDSQAPDQLAARQALDLFTNPARSEPFEVGKLWLLLRWEAARHYGLVQGQAFPVLVARGLAQEPGFLDAVVLRCGARLHRPGVRDLLLAVLLRETAPVRLRAAVRGMPRELARLVDSGLWKPADLAEWRLILDEIESLGLESYVTELFEVAMLEPEIRWRAAQLALRAGVEELGPFAASDLASLPPAERIEALRALGEALRAQSIQRVMAWTNDETPTVASAAWVAGMRLGVRAAEVSVRAALEDPAQRLHKPLIVELAKVVRDPRAAALLDELLPKLEGDLRLFVATSLARDGSRLAREILREALSAYPPLAPERALILVSALGRRASTEDLTTLRALFPQEDVPRTRALNLELATILTELGDPLAQPVVHSALWSGGFEVSVLAASLLVEMNGLGALRDAVLNPPSQARSDDVRRVGFALGMLGGFGELDTLSARLRYNSGAPAVQGALLGVLSTRTH